MIKYAKQLSDDSCWVYVIGYDDGTYSAGISFDEELPEYRSAGGSGRAELLFHKRFDDEVSAAGFCMALKSLSPDSVRRFVRRLSEKQE